MKVRLIGHVGQPTGYGRAAADNAMAMLRAGVELEIRPLSRNARVDLYGDAYLPLARCLRGDAELTTPDAIIVHVQPMDARRVVDILYPAGVPPRGQRPALIAYTTWESDNAPRAVKESLAVFDQLWVPSRLCQLAFAPHMWTTLTADAQQLRVAIPHCFDEETLFRKRMLPDLADDVFTFYTVGAWTARKNPVGIIKAFVHAFTREDKVELLMQVPGCSNEQAALALASCGVTSGDLPIVRPYTGQWGETCTDTAITDLHAFSDCFVTASHGEGWNLPAFDAMLAGRHVIAPTGQGSYDFLQDTTAALVPTTRGIPTVDVKIVGHQGPGGFALQGLQAHGFDARSMWDEPDLVALADSMRHAYKHRTRDLRCDYDPIKRYGYTAVGKLMLSTLTELCHGHV